MPIDEKQEEIIGSTIEELQSKIKMLEGMNASLQLLQTRLRDEIAAKIYIDSVKMISAKTNETRAEDALKKADAFMRVREQGLSYENEIIDDLKTLAYNTPNNADLGEVVRRLYPPHRKSGNPLKEKDNE
jgi:hypothetical protein